MTPVDLEWSSRFILPNEMGMLLSWVVFEMVLLIPSSFMPLKTGQPEEDDLLVEED